MCISFTSQLPAALYDLAIKQLQTMDPEAVDTLLKRKCMDSGYVHTIYPLATFIRCSHMHLVYTLPYYTNKTLPVAPPVH